MVDQLPPRGAAVQRQAMLVSFDVDCGELVPGHRFVARGLAGPLSIPLPPHLVDVEEYAEAAEADGTLARARAHTAAIGGTDQDLQHPGFSFEYELVPGIEPEEFGPSIFGYLVGIDYDADVALPWEPVDGGAIERPHGGVSTHGSRGDWPLPDAAQILSFAIRGIESGSTHQREQPDGTLEVDLGAGSARWIPNTRSAP